MIHEHEATQLASAEIDFPLAPDEARELQHELAECPICAERAAAYHEQLRMVARLPRLDASDAVRRRVTGLKRRKILAETKAGLIVTEQNAFRFGNNHELQKTNMLLLTKLLRDLRRAGISGPDDLRTSRSATFAKKAR